MFSDIQKLKEFSSSRPTVHEMLQEVSQAKGKLYQIKIWNLYKGMKSSRDGNSMVTSIRLFFSLNCFKRQLFEAKITAMCCGAYNMRRKMCDTNSTKTRWREMKLS